MSQHEQLALGSRCITVDEYTALQVRQCAGTTTTMNGKSPSTKSPDDRRDYRRFAQGSLSSSIGPVLDLSTSGMRVIAKKPWCGEVPVRISASGIDITVKATVMWSRKLGFRAYELGLTFTDLDAIADLTTWLAVWNR